MKKLKIVPLYNLPEYKRKITFKVKNEFQKIEYKNFEKDIFYFNTGSVASSVKTEGEEINSNDIIQYLKFNKKFNPVYINTSADLYNAYIFAQKNKLNKKNLLKTHKILSKNLLKPEMQGKIRTHDEIILNEEGKIIYTAAPKEIVLNEFNKLMYDTELLLNRNLTMKEVFYYGFMISIIFVKIHPFTDGNGRLSRLLEKWFIAEKTDKRAWFIKSELNYFNKRKSYFLALNRAGMFYEDTDYRKLLNLSLYTVNTLKTVNTL